MIDRPVGGAPWLTGFQATAPRAGRSGENLLPEARPAKKIGGFLHVWLLYGAFASVRPTPVVTQNYFDGLRFNAVAGDGCS
jgi:hypothetical protein